VGERPGVSRLGVEEKEGTTGVGGGEGDRGNKPPRSGVARFSVERKGETTNTKCYGRKIGARGTEGGNRAGTANETEKSGNHGTDNVLRYATLLREIVTQFDSGKNGQVIWELSFSVSLFFSLFPSRIII